MAIQRLGVLKQAHHALNVIGVDVSDDEQFKAALIHRQMQDALAQGRVSVRRPAVDQNASHLLPTAVFDPKTIAVRGWQHFDGEHDESPGALLWSDNRWARCEAPFGVAQCHQTHGHQVAARQHAATHEKHDGSEISRWIVHCG